MKKYLMILLFAVLGFTGCHIGTSGTWKNDHIDPAVRDKLDVLNKKLFGVLLKGDVAGVKALMSPKLIENAGLKIDTIVLGFKNAYSGLSAGYEVLDEYYTKNTTTNIQNTLFSNINNVGYKINYLALNEEMYATVLATKNVTENCGVLAIYGKYDDGWKINILQVGDINIMENTGPDFYNKAVNDNMKGNLIDAVDDIVMARQLSTPFNDWFAYDNLDKMKAFYNKLLEQANEKYKMPLAITSVKSQPQIFNIAPQLITEPKIAGVYPIVRYKTNIPLEDTIALKDENTKIQSVIGATFQGIDKNKKMVLYQAFNQLPDGKTIIKHYGFVQKL